MHQRLTFLRKKLAQPSRALVLIGVVITLLLCYLVFKTYSHNKSHYTNKSISLPDLTPYEDELEKAANDKNNAWQTVTTLSGDTLGSIFTRVGLTQQTLLTIVNGNVHAKALSNIKPNQQIQFLIRDNTLEKLIIPLDATQVLLIYRESNRYISKINSREMTSHNEFLTATVRGSLYGTAKRQNLPYKLVQQMTEIFNWEIDFSKDVRPGDQFSIVYKAFYIDDKLITTGEILAVSYTNKGQIHQAIRHVNAAGDYDYYSPTGVSLKKAFSRYPIKFSHISSTFSLSRQHPILHYSRPHKGVDLAAPIGTPIHATGDGRIEIIGRQNDYGNMIKISHNKTYSSVYGHLLKFQKGLSRGNTVKRGQIIGFVGQSGLATGPHCHYEFHVNHNPRNPSTVQLPRSSPVSSREIASFKANANILLARLKLYEDGNLVATKGKKSINTG